jgi:hypothetical protein
MSQAESQPADQHLSPSTFSTRRYRRIRIRVNVICWMLVIFLASFSFLGKLVAISLGRNDWVIRMAGSVPGLDTTMTVNESRWGLFASEGALAFGTAQQYSGSGVDPRTSLTPTVRSGTQVFSVGMGRTASINPKEPSLLGVQLGEALPLADRGFSFTARRLRLPAWLPWFAMLAMILFHSRRLFLKRARETPN